MLPNGKTPLTYQFSQPHTVQ
uniref:Uncharacterized protein n=1 Tax=Rhizophora mucronata TaxID=61149 RepID=A0A2P2IT48_RHIMU